MSHPQGVIPLREFQESLTKRLSQKDSVNLDGLRFSAIVSDRLCWFDMSEIIEVIPFQSINITRTPSAKEHILGVGNLRGTPICVIDLGAWLYARPGSKTGYLLSVNPRVGFEAMLLVDKIERMQTSGETGNRDSFVSISELSQNNQFFSIKEQR